jgi:DNA-binding transcriptional LysR family regulator
LWPRLVPFLRKYPEINVEIFIDYGLTDIVKHRFDAGVRSGEQVARDMIAVRISPDWRMAVVAAPAYLRSRAVPKAPADLRAHRCINLRLTTAGGLYAWELQRGGRTVTVHVNGQVTFNGSRQMLNAALAGFGMAHVPEPLVRPLIEARRLVPVLESWWPTYPGYHLYYPSRRQQSPAFARLVEALRHRNV